MACFGCARPSSARSDNDGAPVATPVAKRNRMSDASSSAGAGEEASLTASPHGVVSTVRTLQSAEMLARSVRRLSPRTVGREEEGESLQSPLVLRVAAASSWGWSLRSSPALARVSVEEDVWAVSPWPRSSTEEAALQAELLASPACARVAPVCAHTQSKRAGLGDPAYLPKSRGEEKAMCERLGNIQQERHKFKMQVPHLRLFAFAPDMLGAVAEKWFGAVERAPGGSDVLRHQVVVRHR